MQLVWSGDSACPRLRAGPTTEHRDSHHSHSDGRSEPRAQGVHLEQTALSCSELGNATRIKQLAGRPAHGGGSTYSSGNCYYLQHRGPCFPRLSKESLQSAAHKAWHVVGGQDEAAVPALLVAISGYWASRCQMTQRVSGSPQAHGWG